MEQPGATMTLTYGSLFAGVGGFDMGMEQAGYEPVFQVEWDKNCQKILHHHWPTVPKWGDVCDVNGADLPPCDVLIFGSPCQDLSVAGKRAGLQDGDRSSMFFEAVRIIKEMRDATNSIYPRATIWENVPGALSSNKGADFGVVLSSLADIGAITQEYAVLDAQYFRSTPQRRRRIFLVSIFCPTASERCPDPLLPLIQGSRGDFAKGRKARKDATRFASTSIDPSGGKEIVHTSSSFGDFSVIGFGTLRSTGGDLGGGSENLVVQEAFVKSRRAQTNTDDETWVEGDVTPTLNAFDNGGETRATVLMPVAYSIREDAKANNFSATETDTALCLNGLVPSTQSHHAQIFIAEPQPPYVFDATRHDDFRMDTETVPTLKQRMGTGGGQVPMLAEAIITHEIVETLKARGHKGVNTEEAAGGQLVVEAVAYDDLNGTLNTVHGTLRVKRNGDFIAEPIVYDGYNQKLDDSGIHRSLRIGRDSSDFIAQPTYSFDTQFGSNAAVFEDHSPTLKSSQQPPSVSPPGLAVRRLTPLECERLQGWPDDHTRWTADGKEQADTNRYKQCGNGVASPCARWVGEQLRPVLETE
jgi:site-specific DNA-cytosine methylase